MSSPIAGLKVTSVGGLVGFWPYQGNDTPEWGAGDPVVPTAEQTNYLDCAVWDLETTPFFDDVTDTGSYGAQVLDKAAEGFQATVDVIYDLRYPPDMMAKYGAQPNVGQAFADNGAQVDSAHSQFCFNLGVRMTLIQGAGVNYPSGDPLGIGLGAAQMVDFYWSPSVKIAVSKPVIDANNKKMVRQRIQVAGASRIFKLPAEALACRDYLKFLQNRGKVF